MEELNLDTHNGYKRHSPTVRDLVAIVFRHRRPMVLSFLGIFSGAILMAVLQPNRYESAMKILVKRDRVDAVVTPEAVAVPQYNSQVTEEDLNSEVELLKSRELLEKIVLAYDLQDRNGRTGLGILRGILSAKVADLKRVGNAAHEGFQGARRGLATASGVPNSAITKLSSGYLSPPPAAKVLPDTTHFAPSTSRSNPEIKIGVRIDESGGVPEAHALQNTAENKALLANAATDAGKHRIYEPAEVDGRKIPSEHLIDFQFLPGTPQVGAVSQFASAHSGFNGLQSTREEQNTSDLASVALAAPLDQYRRTTDVMQLGPLGAVSSTTPAAIGQHATVQNPGEGVRIAGAVRALEKKLSVDVVRKTNLIAVNYESPDPALAVRVLSTLANLYLEKHVTVHRPPGAFDFFQQEAEQYRQGLTGAEAHLVDFSRRTGVVSALLEKEVALQKLAEFEVTLKQTEAAIAETEQRIRVLREKAASIPTRMVTQVRNADDATLLSQLRSNLLMLEQRRTELLGKFQPTFRLVQEVEAQIAQTRSALSSAERSKLHDETTDRDPTYEWVRAELAKAEADLAGLKARVKATALSVQSYQKNAQSLEQKEVVQESLVRTVKTAEEHYLLYLRKEEEARISDALDRGRILNVAIAEAAKMPSVPSNHRSMMVLVGFFLATLVSLGLAFILEYLDSTFRTTSEVESILDIPVLAAIPRHAKNGATASVF